MKRINIRKASFAAALIIPMAIVAGCAENGDMGTSHEISHTETTKNGWFGGQVHAVNTTYTNSDGSTSIESETTTTKGDTTTIVRVRKTTNLDGTVKTDRETRTIVKGTDNVERETTVTN